MSRNWYAVYTRPKCEKRFCAWLSKKKIAHFHPTHNVITDQDTEHSKTNTESIFPSIVFICIEEAQMGHIKQQNEVINFMFWLERPVTIREIEIESLREFAANHNNISVEKMDIGSQKMNRIVTRTPVIKSDDDVLIMSQTEIRLSLPSLGFTLVSFSDKEILNSVEIAGVHKLMVS